MNLPKACLNKNVGFMSNLNKNLYLNEKKADVFFVCGAEKERIPAHKLILSEASEIFDLMFCEGESSSKRNWIVVLPNTSAEVFKEFLQMFYMDEVNFVIANIPKIIELTEIYSIPNDRLLYELDYVPEQDSPKHIFSVLNDDCIQEIFRKLHIEDYLNAANVCKRFQYIAKLAYPQTFKRLDIDDYCKYDDAVINQTFAVSFLRIFGPLVQSIHCYQLDDENEFLRMIADYCGKTLVELGCGTQQNLDTLSSFRALKKLSLYAANVSHFNLYSQLTSLTLNVSTNLDFMRSFPNLEEAIFIQMNLTASQLAKFLESNPQLKRLEISVRDNTNLPPLMYKHIAKFGHNVESFTTFERRGSEELMILRKLRKLKAVEIKYIDIAHLNRLIEHFARNDVHIDELNVRFTHVTDTKQIVTLKNLKRLTIGKISESLLGDLVEKLPKLEKFEIVSENITAKGIIAVLKAARNLVELQISVSIIPLNLDDYRAILALAENRTKVLCRSECRIPLGVLDSNRKWLKIDTVI